MDAVVTGRNIYFTRERENCIIKETFTNKISSVMVHLGSLCMNLLVVTSETNYSAAVDCLGYLKDICSRCGSSVFETGSVNQTVQVKPD